MELLDQLSAHRLQANMAHIPVVQLINLEKLTGLTYLRISEEAIVKALGTLSVTYSVP